MPMLTLVPRARRSTKADEARRFLSYCNALIVGFQTNRLEAAGESKVFSESKVVRSRERPRERTTTPRLDNLELIIESYLKQIGVYVTI